MAIAELAAVLIAHQEDHLSISVNCTCHSLLVHHLRNRFESLQLVLSYTSVLNMFRRRFIHFLNRYVWP